MQTLITNIEVGEIGSKATTQRTGFSFNSWFEMDGAFFGCSGTMLALMGGDDDDGADIDAYIVTPSLEIGGGNPVRTGYLYASLKTDGTLYIKTTPNMDATRAVTIEFTPATDEYHRHREKLGEGDIALLWGFEFGNVDGADFSLSMMEILPIVKDSRMTRY
jgi:hypothetical protein